MNPTSELDLARELIRLPSTPLSAGEPRIANLLADRLDRAGFAVTVDSYESEHTNVVARWGAPDRPAICLSGHLDTVPVVEEEWRFDPYGAQIVGSRLYGRGAVDMKTGVAALVRAAQEYVSAPPPNAAPLSLVLTAQEEVGSLGAAALTRDRRLLPESRCLLIAEPTSNQPVLGHRGAVWLDLVAEGRSCHGSTPHLGENAVLKLIDALRLVRQWAEDHEASHEVLGRRTLNIGCIRGGTLRNIVPDRATAELDFRTPLEDDAATLADTLADAVGKLVGVEPVLSLPPVFTPADDPWVLLVRRAASRHVDLANSTSAARFFTDASVLTSALGNIPTVICGPGSPDQAHVVDEWCDVDQVGAAAAIYLDVMRAVSAEPDTGAAP
jgi:succinyl-diaminopimelate desuccinylase